jgi:hypothetical protein
MASSETALFGHTSCIILARLLDMKETWPLLHSLLGIAFFFFTFLAFIRNFMRQDSSQHTAI